MATVFPSRLASARIVWISLRWLSLSPWEKLILNTSTRPTSSLTVSGALLAGPMVTTILVFLNAWRLFPRVGVE